MVQADYGAIFDDADSIIRAVTERAKELSGQQQESVGRIRAEIASLEAHGNKLTSLLLDPIMTEAARAGGKGGWGSIAAGWDGASFDAALVAPPGDKERTRLVGDLIGAFFRSYHNVAAGQDEAYLDLDKGLAVIAQHAQALGYDGLILFLDELILWLASHAANLSFIHHETQKLVKLVESQNANRPIPIVSFVARQRDLRKLIGDTVPGAQKLNFDDSVDWSDGRFGVVKLEDRNLPMIANKRVLKPRSEAARQEWMRRSKRRRRSAKRSWTPSWPTNTTARCSG
jgi:hypothetical protein